MNVSISSLPYLKLRCGTIQYNNVVVETPGCMLYTRCCAVPHLLPDVLSEIDESLIPKLAKIDVSTCCEKPGVQCLNLFQRGIRALAGLEGYLVFCAVQDAVDVARFSYNEEKTVSVWTVSGRHKLTLESHMEVVDAFQPDWFQCLSDPAVGGTLPPKRIRKSVDRTLRFLDETLQHQERQKQSAIPFGSIEGASLLSERLRSAKETTQRPVGGFIIEGLDYNEMVDTDIADVLTKATDILPEDKPRLLFGPRTPDQILNAVESGVDLFDTSYPYYLTEKGLALMLFSGCRQADDQYRPRMLVDLNDKKYARDFTPLVDGYSYSYIHHLIQTKEMLAGVLLMKHNLQQYLRFFQQLRSSLMNNTYHTFCMKFRIAGAGDKSRQDAVQQ
ncbi:queuine tRNA-ribosyltransferase accessory subunit 2-like [Corticium candelabrum]|uniref:queuine tRNA-ribosyltransferase accessory subunit 2-like n=1 Tax=Corticium candelabrum TaxID=121492 RepID=UPI002E26A434|nr:queuine tRNA-ribosyltransferase accessory subunit 2-like [Corticium candelabrum]